LCIDFCHAEKKKKVIENKFVWMWRGLYLVAEGRRQKAKEEKAAKPAKKVAAKTSKPTNSKVNKKK
jgi:hypothetical protein